MVRAIKPGMEATAKQEIGAVLDAERRAVDAIARCQHEAEAIVAAARIAAHDIDLRTDRRMSELHARLERRLEGELARLRSRIEQVRSQPVEQDARGRYVEDAVVRLAARLTGSVG